MRIIVSMTSWKLRIGNVASVLKTILNQTVKPDLIELNLSIEEFPNKEGELPEDLKQLMEDNKNIEINWCEGNTWTFKKIIPTLKKFYGEEYYLISIDDDYLYSSSFIGKNIAELEKLGVDAFNFSAAAILGNREIYRSTVFTPDFWENLTPRQIATKHDDGYVYYYLKHVKKAKFANHPNKEYYKLAKSYNPVYATSEEMKYCSFDNAIQLFGREQ